MEFNQAFLLNLIEFHKAHPYLAEVHEFPHA